MLSAAVVSVETLQVEPRTGEQREFLPDELSFLTRILMKDALIPGETSVPALEATYCDIFLLPLIFST